MQEATALIQVIYLPMLILSGILLPVAFLPKALQMIGKSLPAYYVMTLCQNLMHGRTLGAGSGQALLALALTASLATFVAFELFKWDKDLPARQSAKLWTVAVLVPFIALGVYHARALH